MKQRVIRSLKGLLVASALMNVIACSDEAGTNQKAEVTMEITDAPSDNANIKSVMVTVAEVMIDGQKVEGFTRQTIDLKAYREGNTKVLGTTSIDAKTYSNVELVLDTKADANNTGKPGCYVLTYDNQVFNLAASGSEKMSVLIDDTWKASADASNRLVIDFDLRKSIRNTDNSSMPYSFVSSGELNGAVRIVAKDASGFIKGTYSHDSEIESDKIIVFAYKKGTFNADSETNAQADGISFKNAVASAEVNHSITGNAYTLAFLPEGEYELHFAAFSQNSSTGRMHMSALLRSETTVDGSVSDFIKVKGGATTTISATVTGISQ